MAVGAVANNTVDGAGRGVANVHEAAVPKALTKDATDAEESRVSSDTGIPRMTPEMLKECCAKNQGWSLPEHNESLVLHYKGFRKIENLEPYVNAKTIWLECNGISRIEGLESMSGLLSLYLQSNCITRLDNLDGLTSLQYLNLAHNSIDRVEGLANLPNLETINLAANRITDVAGLQGFLERPTLKSVDVSQNYIEDGDAFLDFWEKALPEVQCLYLHRNPCSRALKDYRRRLVSGLTQLRWIDDRKVDELERVGAEAWATGGKNAEFEAKRDFVLQEREAKAKSFQNYQRMSQAAAARLRAQKEAEAARSTAEAEAKVELEETGALAEGWLSSTARSSARTAEAFAEPSQQSELQAKVRAFLASRSPPTVTEAGAEAFVQGADTEASGSEVQAIDAGTSGNEVFTEEGGELLESTSLPEPEDVAEKGKEEEEEVTADVSACSESLPTEEEEFIWTDFREKRLGSLTAEFHFNFQKVALRLSEEFSCTVDSESCRRQYRELLKPRGKVDPKADTGRACDAPSMEPSKVEEVSKWWIRQVSLGRNSREVKPTPQVSKEQSSPLADNFDAGEFNYELESAYARVEHRADCVSSNSAIGAAGGLLGDMQRYEEFAPQARVPAVVPEVIDVFAPKPSCSAVSGVKKTSEQSELFDLD